METKAQLKNCGITPRKMRLVADLMRGKAVDLALAELSFTRKAGAPEMHKLLLSARANAVNNHSMDGKRLVIKAVFVDEGVTMKRVLPRARGRADRINKRSSHATIVVAEA